MPFIINRYAAKSAAGLHAQCPAHSFGCGLSFRHPPSFRNVGFARRVYLTYFAQLPLAAIGLASSNAGSGCAAFAAILVALFSPGVGALRSFHHYVGPADPDGGLLRTPEPERRREQHHLVSGRPHYCLAFDVRHRSLCHCPRHFHARQRGIRGAIETYLKSVMAGFAQADQAAMDAMLATIAEIFPGIAAASWILMNIINCVMAQRFRPPRKKISARNRFIPT